MLRRRCILWCNLIISVRFYKIDIYEMDLLETSFWGVWHLVQSFITQIATPSTGEDRWFSDTVLGMVLFGTVGEIGAFKGVMVVCRIVVKVRFPLYFLVERLVKV